MAETALLARCHWLLRARWVFVAALAAGLALSDGWLKLQRHTAPLWAVAAFIAVYNTGFTAFERRPKFCRIGERRDVGERIAAFVFVQMALDAVALTVLLSFSGGIQNPIAFFYIFHVALAGILLRRRLCYALASLATGLVVAVAVAHLVAVAPLNYGFLSGVLREDGLRRNGVFVSCYLAAFACTMYVTAYLTSSVAADLRRRESELLSTAEALRETSQKLAALEERKSQFMLTAAHQLKSPLAAVVSLLQASETGPVSPEKREEMVARAATRANGALRQVQELLDLARLRALDPERQARQVLDFREVLDSVRATIAAQAEQKRVRIEFQTPDRAAWVEGVRDDLFTAVLNLVENAVKYTDGGGTAAVALRPQNGGWELVVSDTGIGIPQAALPNLFSEFFRAGNAIRRKIEGTGLGLSIVEQVVRMHGGRIRVDSDENRGATFTVWLPRAP
jgi:signal transduction histidine kinase